jgi:tripartite-type tricarboxylate transporter receptor subunit TctC
MKKWNKKNKIIGMQLFIFLFAVFLTTSSVSLAQEFPTKSINILIGGGPGGAQDTSVRLLAKQAEKILGQPLVLNNNAGGAGVVALTILKSQKPDGYSLMGGSNTILVATPHLRDVGYTPEDFVPILQYAANHSGLYVRGDSPWKTFKEFIAYVKQNPGKINYTTTTVGSGMHIAMEFVAAKEGGLKWTAVPYTTGDPVVPLLGSHVQAASTSIAPTTLPHIKSGTLRLLAVYADKRVKTFPDVPTLKELGYDYSWEGESILFAPKGTPAPVLKKLDDVFRQAASSPEFIKTLESMVIDPEYRNSADTKKRLADTYTRMGKIIDQLKIPKESAGK